MRTGLPSGGLRSKRLGQNPIHVHPWNRALHSAQGSRQDVEPECITTPQVPEIEQRAIDPNLFERGANELLAGTVGPAVIEIVRQYDALIEADQSRG